MNEAGITQAEKLAVRLADEPCEIIYTSHLLRAQKTAVIINMRHGVELVASSQLRESSFGEFEGKSLNDPEAEAAFGRFIDKRAPAQKPACFSQCHNLFLSERGNCFTVSIHIT